MAWTNKKGWNFRSTLAFVTDGTRETFVAFASTYPQSTVIDGDTVAWGYETQLNGVGNALDNNAALDRRCAGMHYYNSGSQPIWRLDLPSAGNYKIALAMGSQGGDNQKFEIRDSSLAVITIPETGTGANNFIDATDALRISDADWAANEIEVVRTFATTILRIVWFQPSGGSSCMAHFAVTQVLPSITAQDKSKFPKNPIANIRKR